LAPSLADLSRSGLIACVIKAKTLDGAMVKLDIIDPYRNDAPMES
jgi:hypothetical protein